MKLAYHWESDEVSPSSNVGRILIDILSDNCKAFVHNPDQGVSLLICLEVTVIVAIVVDGFNTSSSCRAALSTSVDINDVVENLSTCTSKITTSANLVVLAGAGISKFSTTTLSDVL